MTEIPRERERESEREIERAREKKVRGKEQKIDGRTETNTMIERQRETEREMRETGRGTKIRRDRRIDRQAELIDNHMFLETTYSLRCVEFCFICDETYAVTVSCRDTLHHFNTARSRSMQHNSKEINNNELQIGFEAKLQLRHNRDLHIMRKNSFSFWL